MNIFTPHLKWALLFLGTCLCWQVFERQVGWHTTAVQLHYNFLFIHFLFLMIFYYMAYRENFLSLNHEMGFSSFFVFGLMLTFVICMLLPFTMYIFYNFISPDLIDNLVYHKVRTDAISIQMAESGINSKVLLTRIPFTFALSGIIASTFYATIFRKIQLKRTSSQPKS